MFILVLLSVLIATFLIFIRIRRKPGTVAFFHPYCNAGGGGERVLWCAIRAMQERWPDHKYVVFSGDTTASKEQILLKAKQRFGIEVDPAVDFIFLKYRRVVEADLYPRLTLVLQTIGGFFLGAEALMRLNPEVFIDSMGYPLTLPLFKWIAGSRVAAYVHYPTISCDMIDLVERRESTYNNSDTIAQSGLLSQLKLWYYKTFARIYGLCGRAADCVMVNGSWTKGHISKIWGRQDLRLLFPPCDVTAFLNLDQVAEEIFADDRILRLLSVGQIRPEKNHKLQLEILQELNRRLGEDERGYKAEFTIAGGCRNKEDQERVDSLQKLAHKLGVEDSLKWKLNVPYDDLLQLLSESLISVHTMWNEHFGISVVDGMAAGTIMLAHNSGGPQMDIVVGPNEECVGYLASTRDEFVDAIMKIVDLKAAQRDEIRKSARLSTMRFSEEEFAVQLCNAVEKLIE